MCAPASFDFVSAFVFVFVHEDRQGIQAPCETVRRYPRVLNDTFKLQSARRPAPHGGLSWTSPYQNRSLARKHMRK